MGLKILVVEDNEAYCAIVEKKLIIEQFEVIIATDGIEGLEKAVTHKPDLVLMDLLLPKMNGIEMLEELRKNEWGKNVPVLILTNLNPDQELIQGIDKNRPASYLIKPQVTIEQLVEKIRTLT